MRVSRTLRERVQAKSLERQVEEISKSLTQNWEYSNTTHSIVVRGFRDVGNLLQDHHRRLDVLSHAMYTGLRPAEEEES